MTPNTRAWSATGGETAPVDETAYNRLFPYYAEICALSELRKKPGFGVPVRSGVGGHCLLYLHGARRDRTAGYPVIKLCAPDQAGGAGGVGLSVNSHYRNANWVAADGPDFLWRGALSPGERLTRESYARTQDHAKGIGMLDGVEFHPKLFADRPAGMTERDYMYEISVATDYAALFGRDVVRARVPLDRARMGAVVDYLNGLNAPYRAAGKIFNWRLFNDNCVHVTHNALSAAGVWKPWPTGQIAARAVFNFPVPKNEFVDLMRRANDLPIENARAMAADDFARRLLGEAGVLPTGPGALAIATPAVRDNAVYDTETLRLIFYDNPFWGRYRFRFARIFSDPRYVDLAGNLRHFSARYEKILQQPAGGAGGDFQALYQQCIARDAERLNRALAGLAPRPRMLEAAS